MQFYKSKFCQDKFCLQKNKEFQQIHNKNRFHKRVFVKKTLVYIYMAINVNKHWNKPVNIDWICRVK